LLNGHIAIDNDLPRANGNPSQITTGVFFGFLDGGHYGSLQLGRWSDQIKKATPALLRLG